jgi:hypothetical protein
VQLYEKIISPAGRVTYREYKPSADIIEDKEIEAKQVVTILCSLVISMLMSISGQLLPHSRIARETKILEQAVLRYAKLNGAKVDPSTVDVGVMAWNAAVKAMQEGLLLHRSGGKP